MLFSNTLVGSKATVGMFGKSLESSGDFSMRCQCLTSNFLRWCAGKCGEYVVVKVMQACSYCWILVGLIWVLISRMPSLANLSPLYKHRSRNVISSVKIRE